MSKKRKGKKDAYQNTQGKAVGKDDSGSPNPKQPLQRINDKLKICLDPVILKRFKNKSAGERPWWKFWGKKKKAEEEKVISNPAEQLVEIYENTHEEHDPKDTMADIIKKRKKKHRARILIASIISLCVLTIVAILGFVYFNPTEKFTEQKVSLEIQGPDNIRIGQDFSYVVNYNNQGDISLTSAVLELRNPNNFSKKETEPEADNEFGTEFDLGILRPGESGQIKVSGRIVDQIDQNFSLQAILRFVPANFNYDFSKKASHSLYLEPWNLKTELEYPEEVSYGEKINLKVKITNEEDEDLAALIVRPQLPEGFAIQASEPEAAEGKNHFLLQTLKPGEERELYIEGILNRQAAQSGEEGFASEEATVFHDKEAEKFVFEYLYADEDEDYFFLKKDEMKVSISDKEFSVNTIVNGSNNSKAIEFGEDINISVAYKNTGGEVLEDLQLVTYINSSPLDLINWPSDLKTVVTDDGKRVIWSKSENSQLSSLGAKEGDSIDFTLPTKSLKELKNISKENLRQLEIVIYSEIVSNVSKPEEGQQKAKSSEVRIVFNSDMSIISEAFYYNENEEEIGEGPLPPVVDEETKVLVVWEVSNSIHELQDVKLSATLPMTSYWENEADVSAGKIEYDKDTREILWTVNRLPNSVNTARAEFYISFVPEETDAGQLMVILNKTTAEAADLKTGADIIKTSPVLTSNLDYDELATGNGIVRNPEDEEEEDEPEEEGGGIIVE